MSEAIKPDLVLPLALLGRRRPSVHEIHGEGLGPSPYLAIAIKTEAELYGMERA